MIDFAGKACQRCKEISVGVRGGVPLCKKHKRFYDMRSHALRNGKIGPHKDAFDKMLGADLICPDCKVKMNWLQSEGSKTVATLQHYRDGTFALVCMSCNCRHGSMKGDTFRDLPPGYKYCRKCDTNKPFSEFKKQSKTGYLGMNAYCIPCFKQVKIDWRNNNRDHFNQWSREYKARKKKEKLNG